MQKILRNSYNSEKFEDDVISTLKGLSVLISGMIFANNGGAGEYEYQKEAYILIEKILCDLIDNTQEYRELIIQLDEKIESLELNNSK